jgi:hypothetical protein
MSTTIPAQPDAPAGDALQPQHAESVPRPFRLVGPAALGLGAVLGGTGLALHLGAMPEDERLIQAMVDDPNWTASHVLLGLGFALVAIGAAHAVTLVRGRGTVLTGVGAMLTSFGAVLMALSNFGHGALNLALRGQVDNAQSMDIHESYFEHPAILGTNTGPMLITLGMSVLGIGLLQSRGAPRWAGALVLVTPIAINASFMLSLPPYLQGLPFLVGMLVLTWLMAQAAHRR